MRRKLAVVGGLFLVAGVAWLQVPPQHTRPLAGMLPPGALLSIEGKDFGALLDEWNRSSVKSAWLKSADYQVFAQSNLLQKINGVYGEYLDAAGSAFGMPQVIQLAGTRSALALYDPRELQFLYITDLSNAHLTQSQLWMLREKFETRQAAGKTFYLRTNSKRTVAFAFSGGYFFLGTRDDLVAKALALQVGSADPSLSSESWYADAQKASAGEGELRMMLNLEALVNNSYFRSYWVQRNISELRPFRAEVCDLDRSNGQFIERRVLLRKPDVPVTEPSASERAAMAELIALAPATAGLYRAWAAPTPDHVAGLIRRKLLYPNIEGRRNWRYAPDFVPEVNTGSEADLETHIDAPPLPDRSTDQSAEVLRQLLAPVKFEAALQVQWSEQAPGSEFISTPTALALVARDKWDLDSVRDTLAQALASRITESRLGTEWRAANVAGQPVFEMDGLANLQIAVRGQTLFLANERAILEAVLSNKPSPRDRSDFTYAASFRHASERAAYHRITHDLDSGSESPSVFMINLASLSDVLANIRSIDIAERSQPGRVEQTVTYR